MASLTATQLRGLDLASERATKKTASQTDLQNLAYATKKFGYKYKPKNAGLNLPSNPIPADQLGTQNNYDQLNKILGANITPDMLSSDTAGLLALSGASTESQQKYDKLTGDLTGLMGQLGGQSADFQTEMDKQGVGNAYAQMKELNMKAAQLQGEISKFDVETDKISTDLEGQAIPTGLIQGQQAQLNQQRTMMHNAKVAELTATTSLAQAYQGNATLGMELAQKAVDMKYAPMEQQIETLKTQIGFAKDSMTREDSKRADIITAIANEQATNLADKKKVESDISSLAVEAASNGAPMGIVDQMKKAPDAETAAAIGGKWAKGVANRKEQEAAGNTKLNTMKEVTEAQAKYGKDRVKNINGAYYLTKAPKATGGGGGSSSASGAGASYVNVSRTKDASGGYSFFGKNKTTGKTEPIGAAVYAMKQGIPLDQILAESKTDKDLVAEIKQARQAGDSDETILQDLFQSGNFKHLFVGL